MLRTTPLIKRSVRRDTRENVRPTAQEVDSGRGQSQQGEWSREGADTIGHWHEERRNARRETASHT